MATDATSEIQHLVEQLADDPEALQRVKDTVVRELQLREAIHQVAEARGMSAKEIRGRVGTGFRFTKADDDPLVAMLDAAPGDDEPLTDEDLAAIAEGKADIERGDVVSSQDLKQRFGLS
jgi:hypothetical protein